MSELEQLQRERDALRAALAYPAAEASTKFVQRLRLVREPGPVENEWNSYTGHPGVYFAMFLVCACVSVFLLLLVSIFLSLIVVLAVWMSGDFVDAPPCVWLGHDGIATVIVFCLASCFGLEAFRRRSDPYFMSWFCCSEWRLLYVIFVRGLAILGGLGFCVYSFVALSQVDSSSCGRLAASLEGLLYFFAVVASWTFLMSLGFVCVDRKNYAMPEEVKSNKTINECLKEDHLRKPRYSWVVCGPEAEAFFTMVRADGGEVVVTPKPRPQYRLDVLLNFVPAPVAGLIVEYCGSPCYAFDRFLVPGRQGGANWTCVSGGPLADILPYKLASFFEDSDAVFVVGSVQPGELSSLRCVLTDLILRFDSWALTSIGELVLVLNRVPLRQENGSLLLPPRASVHNNEGVTWITHDILDIKRNPAEFEVKGERCTGFKCPCTECGNRRTDGCWVLNDAKEMELDVRRLCDNVASEIRRLMPEVYHLAFFDFHDAVARRTFVSEITKRADKAHICTVSML